MWLCKQCCFFKQHIGLSTTSPHALQCSSINACMKTFMHVQMHRHKLPEMERDPGCGTAISGVLELKAIVLQESHLCCANAFFGFLRDQWIIILVTNLCQILINHSQLMHSLKSCHTFTSPALCYKTHFFVFAFTLIICIFLWVFDLSSSFPFPSLAFQATNVS